ncbi:hypothetical protein FC62_GL000108 [Amylolactobacillus amylotrophicus DSM 20534]|uniref:Zinc metalloprotease n=3 Tax=Amylolactobacillus TaxID=2767876 RepID=A0A0R1YSX3_9LACO|nr:MULTISPECIES: RIP metalloprotease RseP [Amylolactobacillus]APT17871.1 RIP metalloprotease RseP [Amylolactobacillus amylophilus DSM 20533 = JCM 1125]KRK38423.1 hypothetical protein FC62_GL000108 [Amylolactobacillus amylotrophicus DSM 20534]KRM42934.1 hypothetical protein FD40_GL000731 [Amylolactobacillus amylophilus DSM 20533 = JCM 1125]GED79800.1 zinc metalloprotease [Amylolactobacillus amylophilus]
MSGILIFIVVFGILVFVHEFGHFIVSKKSGVLVREFSIGMGPKLFQKMYHQTTYTIRWLPLGGYVRLAGPDDAAEIDPGKTVVLAKNEHDLVNRIDASESDLPIEGIPVQVKNADLVDTLTIEGYENGAEDNLQTYNVDHDATIIDQTGSELIIAPRDTQFQEANIWQKIATNIAGPLMNILLGFVVFMIWSLSTTGPLTTSIKSTVPNSPAAQVGMKAGDQITTINGSKITSWDQIPAEIDRAGRKDVRITVKRGTETKSFAVKPKIVETAGQKVAQVGIYPASNNAIGAKVNRGFSMAVDTTTMIFRALGNLVASFSLNKLSGPVGIYSQTAQMSKLGFTYVLAFLASISINLGIVNLLPIPGLDGGKLLLNIVELFRRKPIPVEKEGIVNLIGFGLLLLLIIAVTGNDIYRYFIK